MIGDCQELEGGENKELMFNGNRVPVLQDKKSSGGGWWHSNLNIFKKIKNKSRRPTDYLQWQKGINNSNFHQQINGQTKYDLSIQWNIIRP